MINKIKTVVIGLIMAFQCHGQFDFETFYTDDLLTGTFDFNVFDVDGDGDADVVSNNFTTFRGESVFTYYDNVNGVFKQKYFDFKIPEELTLNRVESRLGKDSKVDFYTRSGNSLTYLDQHQTGFTKIELYQNPEVGDDFYYLVGHFNSDDLIDFLVFSAQELVISQYLQNSSGGFSESVYESNLVVAQPNSFENFYHQLVDLDVDGVDELVLAGYDPNNQVYELQLYKMDGGVFKKTVLSNSVRGGLFNGKSEPLQFKDFNDDGLLDFVVINETGFAELKPVIYSQNASGGFETTVMEILLGFNNNDKSFLRDHDEDGDLDYLLLNSGGTISSLKIIENQDGIYLPAEFVTIISNAQADPMVEMNIDNTDPLEFITSKSGIMTALSKEGNYIEENIEERLLGASTVVSADVDNDGDTDFLISNEFVPDVKFYEHQTNSIDPKQIFKFTDEPVAYAYTQVNQDQMLDIIFVFETRSSSDDTAYEVVNYLNNGDNFFSRSSSQMLVPDFNGSSVELIDVDNDEDLDVFIVNDGSVSWFENRGNSFSDVRPVVRNTFSMLDDTYTLGDFNGDSLQDFVLTNRICLGFICDNERTLLYEYNSGTANFELKQLLFDDVVSSLASGDLNGDGTDEFMYGFDGRNWVIDFNQPFTVPSEINLSFNDPRTLIFDVGQDGILDVIGPSSSFSDPSYFTLGADYSVTSQVFSDRVEYGFPVHFGDYDADGDLDMLATNTTIGGLVMQLQSGGVQESAVPVPINKWSYWLVVLILSIVGCYYLRQKSKVNHFL